MAESARRLSSFLDPSTSLEGVDSFIFSLESLLPPEAEIMWISPAAESEQIISVCFKNQTIYFCGEDLSSEDFLNWNHYQCPKKLRLFLERRLKIDQAHTVEQLALYIRHAVAVVGMKDVLVIETYEDEVTLHNAKTGDLVATCGLGLLPKSFQQVKADMAVLLEIQNPEWADDFDSFLELFVSVNANEFQGAFNFLVKGKAQLEVIYQKGKKHRQDKFIRLCLDKIYWKEGVSRTELVEFLTDQMKDRMDDRKLEFMLFTRLLKTLALDYPALKYKISLNNVQLLSADNHQWYFMGIKATMAEEIKSLALKYCADKGYWFGEIDCAKLTQESVLRAFLEYDLGYPSPEPLSEAETRK